MTLTPAATTGIFTVIGYFVSLTIGQYVTAKITAYLWKHAEYEARQVQGVEKTSIPIRTSPLIARWHGTAERFLYTSAIVLEKPEAIAVWLAFKAVMRWSVYEDDARHVPGSAIYMVGTVVSLSFGVVGGLIARRALEL